MVKVEPPEGDSLRAWSASGAAINAGDGGALFSFLAVAKHSVVADPADAGDSSSSSGCWHGADAVVWSRGFAAGRAASLAPRARFCERHPHLMVTAITPFGLDGPWRDRRLPSSPCRPGPAGASGSAAARRTGRRCIVGGQVGDWLAGAYAAACTLASRVAGAATPAGASWSTCRCSRPRSSGLTYYPVTYFEMLGRPWRTERKPTVPGVAQASDGLVALGLRHGAAVVRSVRHVGPSGVDRRELAAVDHRAGQHARRELYAWLRSEHGRGCPRAASAFRIPNSPVGNGANVAVDWTISSARGSSSRNPRDGFVQPDRPYRLHGVDAAPRRSPRRGSASTPMTTATSRSGRTARGRGERPTGCRSRACGCWT